MPEGPEIRREADRIAKAVVGKEIEELAFKFEHLKRHEEHLGAMHIQTVEPRGKGLLLRFEDGHNIFTHNQLYGRWYVRKRDQFPKTNRDLRLAIHTKRHSALLYSASTIEVLHDLQLDDHPFLKKLGPDVLSEHTTPGMVLERLQAKKWRRKKLSSLFLDQAFLSGPGNYLRSEILFVAKVHHDQRPEDLDAAQLGNLAEAALDISRRAYELKGVTNDPQRAAYLKDQGFGYEHRRFFVFNRDDEPCYDCGAPIIRDESGSRRIYWCPQCQPSPH